MPGWPMRFADANGLMRKFQDGEARGVCTARRFRATHTSAEGYRDWPLEWLTARFSSFDGKLLFITLCCTPRFGERLVSSAAPSAIFETGADSRSAAMRL